MKAESVGTNAVQEEVESGDTADGRSALEAWLEIVRPVETVTNRLETALSEKYSICVSAYEIMSCLVSSRGWTPLSEICRAVGRSQPRISRLVTQMQDADLVDRERVEGDGRAFQIRLTRKGRRVFHAASDVVSEVLHEASNEDTPIARLLAARI